MEFIEKHLHEYDIVCFQEVFALFQEHKDVLIMCAQKAGYFFYAMPKQPGF
jgi:hypothetical protein